MTNAIVSTFVAFALTSSPAPAPNYCSWISPEIAEHIETYVINGEYHEYLDFNGDGILSIADAVGNVDAMYWEFDIVDGDITRKYEITTDRIITARIYIELCDYSTDFVTIEINPFEERARVIS